MDGGECERGRERDEVSESSGKNMNRFCYTYRCMSSQQWLGSVRPSTLIDFYSGIFSTAILSFFCALKMHSLSVSRSSSSAGQQQQCVNGLMADQTRACHHHHHNDDEARYFMVCPFFFLSVVHNGCVTTNKCIIAVVNVVWPATCLSRSLLTV